MEDAARKQRILKKYESRLKRSIANNQAAEETMPIIARVRQSKLSLFKGQRKIALRRQSEKDTEYQREILKHLAKIGNTYKGMGRIHR